MVAIGHRHCNTAGPIRRGGEGPTLPPLRSRPNKYSLGNAVSQRGRGGAPAEIEPGAF